MTAIPTPLPASPRRRNREQTFTLELEGRAVPLRVRRNARARRLVLTIDTAGEGVVVTVPNRVAVREGVELARSKAGWILGCLDALPPRTPFADGAVVPVLGVGHRVRHCPGRRGTVWREEGEIVVAGRPEHLARRLTDWLRRTARLEITARVADKAARLGRTPGRVTIRDTRSRWGSCSADGNLSFSWRLVLMPEAVLDYVVAHEVAHLAYRGHGPRFWGAVARLTNDPDGARAWIRRHGESMHRYG